ncbi:MAG: hypothetical protein H6713_08100 [Myxococcales bacterium]|nr:hypothetical protein [Myxococcales bacterium]MCB9749950.1 hypothetical protein [Myxococcales bacterium]
MVGGAITLPRRNSRVGAWTSTRAVSHTRPRRRDDEHPSTRFHQGHPLHRDARARARRLRRHAQPRSRARRQRAEQDAR